MLEKIVLELWKASFDQNEVSILWKPTDGRYGDHITVLYYYKLLQTKGVHLELEWLNTWNVKIRPS